MKIRLSIASCDKPNFNNVIMPKEVLLKSYKSTVNKVVTFDGRLIGKVLAVTEIEDEDSIELEAEDNRKCLELE